jgi:hypothetical protein
MPEVLELDYNSWRCGGFDSKGALNHVASQSTRLLSDVPTHHSCCLGLVLLAVDTPAEALLERTIPANVHMETLPDTGQAKSVLNKMIQAPTYDMHGTYTSWVEEAIGINDSRSCNDINSSHEEIIGARISALEPHLTEGLGIPVRFINIPGEVMQYVKRDDGRQSAS